MHSGLSLFTLSLAMVSGSMNRTHVVWHTLTTLHAKQYSQIQHTRKPTAKIRYTTVPAPSSWPPPRTTPDRNPRGGHPLGPELRPIFSPETTAVAPKKMASRENGTSIHPGEARKVPQKKSGKAGEGDDGRLLLLWRTYGILYRSLILLVAHIYIHRPHIRPAVAEKRAYCLLHNSRRKLEQHDYDAIAGIRGILAPQQFAPRCRERPNLASRGHRVCEKKNKKRIVNSSKQLRGRAANWFAPAAVFSRL